MLKRLFLLFSICLLSNCSTTSQQDTRFERKREVPDKRLLQVYNNARKGLPKDNAGSISDLKKIVKDHSSSEIAVPSALLLGDYYFNKEKYPAALEYYNFVIQNDLYTKAETDALSRSIRIYQMQNDRPSAVALVDRVLSNSNLPAENRRLYLITKYELVKDTAAPADQLELLSQIYSISQNNDEKSSLTLKAMNIIESKMHGSDLNKIVENNQYSFVQAPIAFRLGLEAFDNADLSKARSYFSRVISLQPQSDIAERSQDLLNQISSRESVSSQTIGVILPLSGKHEAIGKSVLNSIVFAFDLYGKNSPYKLAVFDSEGKASLAQRGVEKLVTEDHVIAIIGSLLSKDAAAVASKAQSLGVPTIVLSQKSDVTETGDFIFRNALTGKMQVHFLVKNAIEKRGLSRFAILYPNDGYGTEYANLFWDEVIAQGGQIAAAQPYNPAETDFRKPIQRLVGTFYIDDREAEYSLALKDWLQKQPHRSTRKKIPDDILPPTVDFDAIFIPDSSKALGQIAAMLAYSDVHDITFLGTNLWNTPTLGNRVGKYMKSSLFTDSLFADDPQFKASAFVTTYKSVFGREPSVFDIQAYDSAILLKAILRSGADSRRAVQQRLSSVEGVPGATGTLSVLPNREITRPVVPLTLIDNKILKVN